MLIILTFPKVENQEISPTTQQNKAKFGGPEKYQFRCFGLNSWMLQRNYMSIFIFDYFW